MSTGKVTSGSQRQGVPKVACLLTAFRRPENLKPQLDAVFSQSIKPAEVALWHNFHEGVEFDNVLMSAIHMSGLQIVTGVFGPDSCSATNSSPNMSAYSTTIPYLGRDGWKTAFKQSKRMRAFSARSASFS